MDTNKPIGRVVADVYNNGERYLKVEPLNTTGISVGSTLLYAEKLGPINTLNNTAQGFIFMNELGQWAVPTTVNCFGPGEVMWVDDINRAHVFPHEAMTRRRFKELKKCVALKAVATREVLLCEWSYEEPPSISPLPLPGTETK